MEEHRRENPFRENLIIERKSENERFMAFLSLLDGNNSGLLYYGVRGSGKTTLLKSCAENARKRSIDSLYIRAEQKEKSHEVLSRIGTAVSNKFELSSTNLKSIFTQIRAKVKARGRFVVFLDDAHNISNLSDFFKEIENIFLSGSEEENKVNFGIVISSTFAPKTRFNVVQVLPFDMPAFNEYLDRNLKKREIKMGEECTQTVFSESSGNIKVIRFVCVFLFDQLKDNEKIITKAHYLSHYQQLLNLIELDFFSYLYQTVPEEERKILRVLSKSEKMRISEISNMILKPLGQTTALMARLEQRGQVSKIKRGEYSIFCNLYGKYVVSRV